MEEELFFEISNEGNIVRLEPKKFASQESPFNHDKDWVKTTVTLKGGKFSGQYEADFTTYDFEVLKRGLKILYNDLNGSAIFSGIERQLDLKITGDGIGHFEVDVTACDYPTFGAQLIFKMSFDQTIIKELIQQLEKITKTFPMGTNFNINN